MTRDTASIPVLDFDPADHPADWEHVATDARGVKTYRPVDLGGCGGCDNGECCGEDRDDDLAGVCCGAGEYGPCA